MRPSPLLLHFADARAEEAYRRDRIHYRIVNTRFTALVVAAMWSLFGILDVLLLPGQTWAALGVRLTGVAIAAAMVAMTFARAPGRWIGAYAFAFVALNILLVFALKLTIPPDADPAFRTLSLFMLVASAAFVVTGAPFATGAALAVLSWAGYAAIAGFLKPEAREVFSYELAFLVCSTVITAISAYMLERTERVSFLRREALSRAEAEIRKLLHNVLPPSIAERKGAGEIVIADSYDSISVLFADIVGFTARSEKMHSAAVVGVLNDLFSRFDAIVTARGLEKIKTIGDCYMVAGSVPENHPGHARDIASVALALREEARAMRFPDGASIEIKIGASTGPATAGVIGQTKFLFDVWGDTVNTASRLESQAPPGEILISEPMRAALGERFLCEGPLIVEAKGKGATKAWRLLAQTRTELRSADEARGLA